MVMINEVDAKTVEWVMKEIWREIYDFVSTSEFQLILQDLYDLPIQERAGFVESANSPEAPTPRKARVPECRASTPRPAVTREPLAKLSELVGIKQKCLILLGRGPRRS